MKKLLSYTCLAVLGMTSLNVSAAIVLDRTR
ncbi:molecular chaperone, partial [Aeromonas hydrophila]|nr:molecular chaperone [Aeromonas hydrophila]